MKTFCLLLLGLCLGEVRAATDDLAKQALAETATPLRPFVAGGQPAWNGHAVQFLFAPAFDLPEVAGAVRYRFTLKDSAGREHVFFGPKPSTPLAPIWTAVAIGPASLVVQGIDANDVAVGGPSSRRFHRAAPFVSPVIGEVDSAGPARALAALVRSPDLRCWFGSGQPEPQFVLYRYPSKIVGAAASALATYAAQQPTPADAPEGRYLLDVHAATKDRRYLDAAVRIAATYEKTQLAEGSWSLFVNPRDGKPASPNILVPTGIVGFLDQLEEITGERRFATVRERALAWIMANPVRTWNWQGQFEDVRPLPPYENMTKHEACDFALHLFGQKERKPEELALALELLRYSEDQFVIWAQPPKETPVSQSADGAAGGKARKWLLPCVLEQYRCYAPVCASSAKLIRTYLAAWRATGDRLHLEKAKALGATLAQTQTHVKAPGRYQTWVMLPPGAMWFNCELMAVRAMQELAAAR
ncbi:MAG: hypothetical protein EBY18_22720 [Alphaproteobacteria bacterium]|nr:hypothetical protein [Alphaproteobacteria bacterium]